MPHCQCIQAAKMIIYAVFDIVSIQPEIDIQPIHDLKDHDQFRSIQHFIS